jgi:HEPN domain-containing protein
MRPDAKVDANTLRKRAAEDREIMEMCRMNEYAPYGPMCFHSQQYAEKWVKAKLLDLGMVPPKIHDILALSKLLPHSDAREKILKNAALLAPYAVDVRYSIAVSDISCLEEEASEIYEAAIEFVGLLDRI